MDLEDAIRARRTTKNFTPEPVDPVVVRELLELAQFAPNHKLTAPWRFRLVGPRATAVLVEIAPDDKKSKMALAPTRVLVSCLRSEDPVRLQEDLFATGAAVQNVLLAATARGLDSFWQSPTIADLPAARAALGLPDDEQLIAMINLGHRSMDRAMPPRPPLGDVYSELA